MQIPSDGVLERGIVLRIRGLVLSGSTLVP